MKRWTAMAVACACLASAGTTSALVIHAADDPPPLPNKPDDLVLGQWLGTNEASLVAVDPNYAITTKHQGGGIGTDVKFGNTLYEVAEIINHPTADLRVIRLETPSGNPANLSEFVAVYEDTDEVGQVAVLGGYGEGRGADIEILNTLVGYQWAGDQSRALRWGANTIDSISTGGNSDVLVADFDSLANGVLGEATLAEGDSGGGYFLWDANQNRWEVAAMHRAVQNNNQALFLSQPELLDGVRLSSYSTFINNAIPEPGSAALLLTTAAGLGLRRRRG